jgi:hypothetical protein
MIGTPAYAADWPSLNGPLAGTAFALEPIWQIGPHGGLHVVAHRGLEVRLDAVFRLDTPCEAVWPGVGGSTQRFLALFGFLPSSSGTSSGALGSAVMARNTRTIVAATLQTVTRRLAPDTQAQAELFAPMTAQSELTAAQLRTRKCSRASARLRGDGDPSTGAITTRSALPATGVVRML